MQYVTSWFLAQKIKWEKRKEEAKEEGKRGHECYAKKQMLLWELMKNEAQKAFQGSLNIQ